MECLRASFGRRLTAGRSARRMPRERPSAERPKVTACRWEASHSGPRTGIGPSATPLPAERLEDQRERALELAPEVLRIVGAGAVGVNRDRDLEGRTGHLLSL